MENIIYFVVAGILTFGFKKLKDTQREMLKGLAISIVEGVALEMLEATGKQKFVVASLQLHSRLPKLVRRFIKQKTIEKFVQDAYDSTRDKLKKNENKIKSLATDTALAAANKLIKDAINSDVEGDKSIVSNVQLLQLNREVEKNVDQIYAELTAKTDFKNKNYAELKAGFKKVFK